MKALLKAGTALATSLFCLQFSISPALSEPAVPAPSNPAPAAAGTSAASSDVPPQQAAPDAGAASPTLVAAKTGPSTIIVTASPIAGSADRFATIVERVDRSSIVNAGGANLADALKDVPGVSGSQFAAGANRPIIRGFDAARVRVMEDGINAFDVSDIGPDHGVPIDPLAAQSIEVVRGPGTLRYGSQAIGGVVNALNNRVPTELSDKPFNSEISGAYNTNGAAGEGSALLEGRVGQLMLHADGFDRRVSDYDTPLGTQENSFDKGDGYSLGSSYFFTPDDHIGFGWTHYDTKYGIPSDTTFIDMRQDKYLERSSFALNAGPLQTLTVDAGYASYIHDEDDPGPPFDIVSTFKNKEWDARGEAVFGKMGFLSAAALGIQAGWRSYSALGDDSDFLLPTNTNSIAGFGFGEAPLGSAIHLQFGARVEEVDIKGTPVLLVPASLNFTPVSGSIGALFDASDSVKLGLTLSSTARAPSVVELFAKGGHDGPGTFETGDPNLKLERSNSIEGTLRIKFGGASLESSLWGSKFTNYIYGQLTGNLCDGDGDCTNPPGADLKELFYTQQDATFWGLENKATVLLSQEGSNIFAVNLLSDMVRAKFADDTSVPRIPPYRVGGGLTWNSEVFDAGVTYIYAGRHKAVTAPETITKGYNELEAQLSWRPFESRRNIELAVIGHNLTDDVQRASTSFNKDDVLLPGRDVRFVLRAAF